MGTEISSKDRLKQYLQSITPELPSKVMDEYLAHWEEKSYDRKTVMTAAGAIQQHLLFVLEGIQRSYFLHEGKEHVMAFTFAPSFSGIPESFFAQSPSRYFLESVTPTRVLQISYTQHQQQISKHRPLETLFRVATERILGGLVERHHELMALDIETRLRNFLQRSPHLLNQIPHKEIASYLRMDPTNFSKLLNKVKILV